MQVGDLDWEIEGGGATRRLVFLRRAGGVHVDLTVEQLEQFIRDLSSVAARWRDEKKEA